MAVETTPLGQKKPDGNELLRNGDNIIADNAQNVDDLITADRGRLGAIEAKNTQQDGRLNNVEAKNVTQDGQLATHAARLANLDNAAGFTGDPLALNDAAFAETLTNGTATQAALEDRLDIQVPPIVAASIASDPTVANSAATMAQNTAGLVPVWKALTAYLAGQRTISPGGDIVTRIANGTSRATYDVTEAATWTISTDKYKRNDLPAGQNYNALTEQGVHRQVAIMTDALAQNAPITAFRGKVERTPIATGADIQEAITWNTARPSLWVRASASGTYGAWREIGAEPTYTLTDTLPAGQDFNLLDVTGTQKKSWQLGAVPADWVAQNMPVNVRGTPTITPIGSSRLMEYLTWEATPRLFTRWKSGGVWGAWSQIGAASAAATTTTAKPASGMKLVGVPITAGHSGSDAPLEATVRMPLLYQAPITRWRLRIQDINPRSGTTRAGAINVSGIWFGTHAGAGAMAGKVQLSGPLTIADGAVEYKTKWFNTPLNAGTEYLLSFGYTKATAPWAMLGYSYQTADDANAGDDNPAGMTKMGTAPFSIAIEAETYTHTPVIASLGDSNSVGVGAANGLHDSWLSQLCRRLKALPDHRGSSGDTCVGSLTGTAYKYTRFSDLTKPDAVIMALGQNDIAVTNTTSAVVIPNVNTVLGNIAGAISDTVYAVNYMPRTNNPWAGFETVRREVNAHLLTQPGSVRDVFDIGAAMSPDDETITPAFDADGTHLNAAGFGAVQAAINRPVTTPPVQYVAL